MLLINCICGCGNFKKKTINKIPCAICNQCGIIRQVVNKTKKEYFDFYKDEYFQNKTYTHTYEQDLEVSVLRLDAYNNKITLGNCILDIGAGNGAFVDTCISKKYKCYGVEISDELKHPFIYNKPLHKNYFPTDYFSTITLHDVLEHLIDPAEFLKEVFRILQQKGSLIIDFPRFHHKAGKHHWKVTEHLWMFKLENIVDMAKSAGFKLYTMYNPIESKEVYIFQKPKQNRTKILVPPGIGDSYWSMIKIKSFCEINNLGIPDVYVSSMNPSKDRSLEFIRKVPFVNAKNYLHHKNPHNQTTAWWKIWHEAYLENGRTIFEDVEGCDYFIAYNGIMRFGKEIHNCDKKYKTDWQFPMFESVEESRLIENYKEEFGEFYVGYFIPHGMYKEWIKEFTVPQIKEALQSIYLATGKKVILIGASWDAGEFTQSLLGEGILSLVGDTTLEQCFALMKASEGIVGFPSGMTFMGGMFNKNLLCLWNKYFNKKFWMNSMPPILRDREYKVLDTEDLDPLEVAHAMINM